MFTICLDAGHYGKYNRSPANKNYYESEAMWKLHLLQKKYLEQRGFKVITTRSNLATDLALHTRGTKSKGCALFISNHSNATGSGKNESIDYVAVYHLTDDTTTKCDDVSKEIANKLAPVIADVMDTKQGYKVLTRKAGNDRNGDGIMNDNYYGVLHGARTVATPALILEHSFHTNTRSTNWLLDDSNLDKLAKAEVEVIVKHFGSNVKNVEDVDLLNGFVTVTYDGKDGLNIRKEPKMGDNVKEVVHGGTYPVVGISADKDWYKLKSGHYITANKKYVKFTAKEPEFSVKVVIDDLNIREGAGTNYKINGQTGKGVFTIVETKAGKGSDLGWGKLKSGAGWISLDFAQKL